MNKEQLFIDDLSVTAKEHNKSGIFNDSYLVGTKIYKGQKVINVQQIHLDKSLLRELRDMLNNMELD